MKIKPRKSKISQSLGAGDEPLSLMDLDSNYIINLLEENMRTRETTIEERIKKKLLIDKSKNLNMH